MAFHDTLGTFDEMSLTGLVDPAVSFLQSNSIDTRSFSFGAEPIYLVVTVTETVVGSGSPAFCFALVASTATDSPTVLTGYDVWRFGNVDYTASVLGITTPLAKGVAESSMTAGKTLFTVPIGMSPQLGSSSHYLTLVVQQVVAGAGTTMTSGKIRAYLTSTPPNGNIVYPDGI